MVDAPRVVRLLQRLSEQVAALRSLDTDRAALRADDERLDALKYRFVVAFETVINVAQHLCASEGWGPPSSNADAVRVLARHDVVDAGLADRLAAGVGFRNVLVHEYAEVDDALVVASLDRVGDLTELVHQVSSWLQARQGRHGT